MMAPICFCFVFLFCSCFQNNVEIHVAHIQSGLSQMGNLHAFSANNTNRDWQSGVLVYRRNMDSSLYYKRTSITNLTYFIYFVLWIHTAKNSRDWVSRLLPTQSTDIVERAPFIVSFLRCWFFSLSSLLTVLRGSWWCRYLSSAALFAFTAWKQMRIVSGLPTSWAESV